jgi:hypothetical protein
MMEPAQWSLLPFAPLRPPRDFRIGGVIARQSNVLTIRFLLEGNLAEVIIPEPAEQPSRKGELWKETCFEFFIAAPESPEYREFNLSPSGDWNVWRFDDYRQGMRQEDAVASLPFAVRREPGRLSLECGFDLAATGIMAGQAIEAGISAVMRHRTGETSHFALVHRGERPDFHRRDGFAISLNAD